MTDSRPRSRRYLPLVLAMAASLWVHILGFALLRYAPPMPTTPSTPPMVLDLELPPSVEDSPEVAQVTTPKEPVPLAPEPPEPQAEPEPAAEPRISADEPTVGALLSPPEILSEDQEQETFREDTISLESRAPEYLSYLGQIKAGIANHWIFPTEARKKPQAGRVTVVFTIDRFGQLLSIKVTESSGRLALDNAALIALKGAAPFDPFPDHIRLDRLNIQAHFDYQIKYLGVQ